MYNITVNTGTAQYTVNNLGSASVEINGQGPINFNDVGNRKLGPNSQTWGVCITFQDSVWAFRYEGGGQLAITYNASTNSLSLTPGSGGTIAQLTS